MAQQDFASAWQRSAESVTINLRMLSGVEIGSVSIAPTDSGCDLVKQARALMGNPRGVLTMVAGDASVIEWPSIRHLHGTVVRCVLAEVTDRQEEEVSANVFAGVNLEANMWQTWDGIRKLRLPQFAMSNRSLENVSLPSSLQTIEFGFSFNQSLENVNLPNGLQRIELGSFNQSLENVTLPSSLQTIEFGLGFNQSLENVNLPNGLQTIAFGFQFNQSLENVILPSGLQAIHFGERFNQSLEKVNLPNGLQMIRFGLKFNQSLENVTLPSGLQTFTFGDDFNQNLENVILPSGL